MTLKAAVTSWLDWIMKAATTQGQGAGGIATLIMASTKFPSLVVVKLTVPGP
jgi:hypothetical protein